MKRSYIFGSGINELTDARRIVHRLVLERRETVVEHRVGDVQLIVLVFRTMQVIFCHLDVHCLALAHLDAFSQRHPNLLYHLIELREELGVAHFIGILRIPELADEVQLLFLLLIAQQHLVDAVDFIHRIPIAEDMTIVEQIVCQRQLEQQEDEQDDGHRLGVF